MTPSDPGTGDDGQSPATKDWIARRDAFARAEDAVRKRGAEERLKEEKRDAANQGGSPTIFILSMAVVAVLLLIFGWYFINKMQCDPVFMDRGMSAACMRPH